MSEFKLISTVFSELDKEQQGTYLCLVEFELNLRKIVKITITDHPGKKPSRKGITKELILDILGTNFHQKKVGPRKRHSQREVFVEEFIPYEDKDFVLIFGFKDNTDNHLGIRNCYPIS